MSEPRPEARLTVEDTEDALLEGDRPFAPGTARAALSYPVFRRVFVGAFLSNVGSWMQNVVLGAYGYSSPTRPPSSACSRSPSWCRSCCCRWSAAPWPTASTASG